MLSRKRLCLGFTLIELLVVIAIIAVLIGLLLPAVQKVREAAARTQCTNNLKQIGLALHMYHDVNGFLPQALAGKDVGATTSTPESLTPDPAYSWHIYILPYIEQQNLYNLINPTNVPLATVFSTPSGLALLRTPIKTFLCPSDPPGGGSQGPDLNYNRPWTTSVGASSSSPIYTAKSNYLGNGGDTGDAKNVSDYGVGPQDGVIGINNTVRIADISDGTSNTFLAGERQSLGGGHAGLYAGGSAKDTNGGAGGAVGWESVIGLTYCQMQTGNNGVWNQPDLGFGSQHIGGANFVFCDGSVRFISQTIPWADTVWGANALTYNMLGNRSDGLVPGPY